MKIKKTDLIKAMKDCMPGVERGNPIIDGADTFVFTGKAIQSYNDNISVIAQLTTNEKLKGIVKSVDFYNLINKLENEEISIEEKSNRWHIKNGNVTAKIKLLENKIAGHLEGLKIDNLTWSEIPKGMFFGMKLCSIVGNYSPHSGLYAKGKLMVSTDQRRINYYDLPEKVDTFYIMDTALKEVLKFNDLIEYSVTPAWVHFKTNNKAVFSCRYKDDETFPFDNIVARREAMKKEDGDITNKLPESLNKCIDRIATLSRDLDGNQALRLTFSKDSVQVYSSRESGSISENIPLEIPFKEDVNFAIWVDVPFIKEAISKVPSFYIKKVKMEDETEMPVLIFDAINYTQIIATIVPND